MRPPYYCNSLTQLIFLILLQLIQLCRATIFSHSLQQCQEKCLERNLAFPLPHDHLGWPNFAESNCEFDCLLDACRLGCQDLESLNSSCDLRCDSIGAGSAACNQGCRAIADIFLHQIQHLLDFASVESFSSPVSPGIGLNWSFPEAQSTVLQEISTTNIHWVAQSRAAGKGQGWRWTPMEPKAFKENLLLSTVFAPAEAHSDIELRLAAIWRDIVVVSRLFRQSVLIESQDAGSGSGGFPRPRPTEGPQMQLSDASFVVCWNTAARSAAAIHETPLFRLRLFSTGEDGTLAELVAANRTSSNCHLFRNVTEEKGRRFRLAIAEMGQLEQQSPEQEQEKSISEQELQVNVTLEKINEPEAAAPVVVFTDGASLYLLDKLDDFVMVTEPAKIQLSLNESQAVTALGCLSSSGLLIGLSDGSIFSCDILEKLHSAGQDANETTDLAATRVRVADGIAIRQILVDHLQERFYAVRDKLGIVRCQLHSCDNSTTLAMTNAPNFLQRMAPDPWNGFLYYSYNTGDVFSTPLFPLDASQNYSQPITRRIAELPPVSTLEVDLREQRLMVVTKAGQLLSRDLVDGSVQETREGWTLNDQYKNVIRSQFHRNRLFWISTSCGDSHPWESCLYSEEFNQQDKTIHLNKYLFTGAVKEFVLLRAFYSPPFMIPPAKVGLLLTEAEALISWKPPLSLPYQASGSVWRSLSYEFILQLEGGQQNGTDTQTSTIVAQSSIHHQTHLHTPISADGDYTALVKACTGAICSAPVSAKNRPIRLGLAHKTVSLLTKRPTSSSTPTSAPDSTDPLGQQLVALDLLGRELPAERTLHFPPITSEPSVPIAFDNSSNVLFSSSRKESMVSQRIDGNAVRFLDSAFVHQMALNGPTATIFLATAYSVFAYRMTANFDKIVYNCAVGGAEEECGEVIGIASSSETPAEDGSPAKLFLLVQLPSGVVQLLQTDADLSQPFQTVSSTKDFPHKIRQMAHADGRLLLLTEDGYFGTLDSNLHEFNLNLVVRDVQHLLVADQASRDRHLHFQGPIQFDDKLSQLRWSIAEPDGMLVEKSEQPLLFKLTLFRDGFGSASGERSVAISQESAFTLPPRLLQAWNSRQRFDVQVEAISPWTHAWANRTGLNAATKPPSPPENVRIYATQQRTVDGTRAIIDLFWDEPREWNGEKLGYQLNCSISQGPDQKEPVQYQNTTLLKGSQRTFSFAVRSGRISCLVFAMNDQHLMGPPSAVAEIDGSEFKPLIRLFAIDSTDNLVAIQNWTIEAQKNGGSKAAARFLAKHRRRRQIQSQQQTAQYQTITFVGNELYAVRKEAEMPQLFLAKLDMDQVPNQQILYKASLHGDFTQIDAMAADWVANRLLLVGNRELMQIQLDQLQQDSTTVTPKRLLQLSMGAQDAKQLVFDPFTNTAFLLTKNGSLFALDLNQKTETNLELTTGCLRQKTVTAIVGEFTWNRAASPQLYALTWNGLMELKLGADTCPDINVNWELFGERGLKAISLFAVADKVFVFATPSELLVYDRISASISQFPIPSPPLRQLLAVSQSAQPFPNRDCFQLASASAIAFSVRNEGRTGALVEMAEPQRDPAQFPAECQNISQPQTQYEIQFRKRNTDKKKVVHSSSNKTFIDQGVLDKNTDYDVSASWFNRYWPAQGQSESKPLHTGYGFPSAPKNPQAISLSPDTVLLSWSPPDLLNALPAEIRYRVSQQNPALSSPVPVAVKPQEPGSAGIGRFSSLLAEVVACEAEKEICQAKVPNLRPSTDYHFWVTAVHISRVSLNTADDSEATSVETLAHTRDIPGTLRLENATSTQMNLRWIALPGAESGFPPIESIHISAQYRQSGVDALWTELHNSSFVLEPNNASSSSSSSPQRPICVNELRPATNYDYRYAAEYAISLANEEKKISEFFFQQPQQARTKAGTPSAPTDVQLVTEPDNGGWTLRWKAPDSDGGEPIQSYAVEYRMDSQSEWEIAERGLPADRLYWHVSWAESHARHGKEPSDAELAQGQFRVRAQNAEGFGDFGSTKALDGGEDGKQRSRSGIWWQLLMGLALGLLLCCVAAYATLRWKLAKRRRIRAKLHKPICLESLRKSLFFNSQQIQQSHQTQMQFSLEVQNELKILPKITPDRVKVTRQLGMGSFGRVCEGFVRLDKENNNVRVAIKFLKDNSQENSVKFLKEAILMNNFDHPNIVKLLGVNMEQSEHFLVLELMDGGDLLNFLRDCRPKKGRPSRICMRDLIAMAVDAGRGCLYLETYKHVHRDIAARNCLISSRTSPQRVTKLADFGLARSMTVDYYRVNGQDMLPLRWLSPEVINHGLFTSKSDVWAFGVLLWEIVTLGEQPYANRQNPEVLNLLTNGCTLERPVESPNELFDIMRACWTLDPEKRPRFVDIQPKMESMRGLPHFQARDPFPSGYWNGGFDISQESESTSTRESSTTTNGGDSSAGGIHFEKSENSISTKRHPRLSTKQGQHQNSSAFSTATASTALDSADYELPIRPSSGVQQQQQQPAVVITRPTVPLPASPSRPLAANSSRRRSGIQNDAFVGDSSTEGQQLWASKSYQPGASGGKAQQRNDEESSSATGKQQFGASSSRVSRV